MVLNKELITKGNNGSSVCGYCCKIRRNHRPDDIEKNRETANIALVSSVGRAPVRQSGGHRFKSRSSQFVFVHPKSI